ncbi:hypothetical protein N803_15755 [Knoellia subterranea KCTC 19937]|uniref:Uncharacterized protein n=1 Tax=Knoellia subterranea KCTC 19937 TaxID=1385521 RepID=A0A0A0JLD8_9MICO|nr:hypothetical protein N803_15755 [Knoellia subterranea KCTC 19937]
MVVLGLTSMLSNITTDAQLSGEDQVFFAIRRAASLVLNSGTAWAGISVLAGYLVCRPLASAVAGLLAGSGALVVHYGVGELTGLMPSGSFATNTFWFVAAAVTGAPLGLVGSLARSCSRWGLLARLVVPFGALVEPWAVGWWMGSTQSMAEHVSDLTAAAILTAAGLGGAALIVRRRRRGSPAGQD